MISYNILVRNVRGLNSPARPTVIRGVVQLYRPVVVCFQESKVAIVDQALVRECCGPSFTVFWYLPVVGTRGGILLAWNPEAIDVGQPTISPTFLAASCCWRTSEVRFNLAVVYGPQMVPEKLQFLEDLKPHCPTDNPSLVLGDFNLILQALDKSTNNYNRRTMAAFRSRAGRSIFPWSSIYLVQ
jgi:exonuclease III